MVFCLSDFGNIMVNQKLAEFLFKNLDAINQALNIDLKAKNKLLSLALLFLSFAFLFFRVVPISKLIKGSTLIRNVYLPITETYP